MKQKIKKKNNRKQLVEQNLELVRRFLKEVLRRPNRLASIPNDATLILYPVVVDGRKAA